MHVYDDELIHMDMRQMVKSNNTLVEKVIINANLPFVQSPMKYTHINP